MFENVHVLTWCSLSRMNQEEAPRRHTTAPRARLPAFFIHAITRNDPMLFSKPQKGKYAQRCPERKFRLIMTIRETLCNCSGYLLFLCKESKNLSAKQKRKFTRMPLSKMSVTEESKFANDPWSINFFERSFFRTLSPASTYLVPQHFCSHPPLFWDLKLFLFERPNYHYSNGWMETKL